MPYVLPRISCLTTSSKAHRLTPFSFPRPQDEIRFQDEWAKAKLFEQDAPLPSEPRQDKLFTTMAYPYMNGSLHAGHCFTFSKVEFMTGFARMEGRRALLPQGFHCTGMPIKAAADKLKREVEMFGQHFERADVEEALALRPAPGAGGDAAAAAPPPAASKTDMGKFGSNKSKAVAKTGKAKYQFQVGIVFFLFRLSILCLFCIMSVT